MDTTKCVESIGPLKTLESNGSTFNVNFYESKNVSKELVDWAFTLLENNMRTMYEGCDWGWKPKEKMKELTARKARFLIVFRIESNTEVPVAFVHFRFVKDYGRHVVYCYELQLEENVRSNRIGSWLMKILERVASTSNHPLIVLTVLKANTGAIAFYRKIGYTIDETSPAKSEDRPYFIYSKKVHELSENRQCVDT